MIITCPNCSTRYSLPQDKIRPEGQKVRCAKCGTVWHQEPEEELLVLTADEVVPAAPAPTPAWSAAVPAEPAPPVVPPVTASTEAEPAEAEAPAPAAPAAPAPDATVAAEAAAVTPGIRPDSFAKFHVGDSSEEPSGAGRKIAIAVVVVVVAALGALIAFKQQVQDLTGIQLVASQAAAPAAPAAAPETPPKPKAPEPLTLTFEEVESSIEEIDGVKRLLVKGVIVNPADHEQLVPPLAFNMLDKDGKPIDRWTFAAPVRALAPHTNTRFSSQRDTPPGSLHELVPGFDVPENPAPVIEPTAAPGTPATAAGAPVVKAPATPAPAATTAPKPAAPRPPASQQTPGPIE